MKKSKKILIIFVFLLISSVLSGIFALGLNLLFNFSFWGAFLVASACQISWSIFRSEYLEGKKLLELAKEYSSKPYRKYIIPLNCAHCGSKNEIEIDLTDTEFRCDNCKKYNGIHTNFMTAAITEPIINPEL